MCRAPFTKLILVIAALAVSFIPAKGQGQMTSTDVSLKTASGTLYGTLTLPAGEPLYPVVVIVAGSGMTDRDGNTVGLAAKTDCLKMLAEGLAKGGIASLRYDKRGVAKSSEARLATNKFEQQVDDAAAWVAWTAADKRFRAVGIVGHSEGALIGTIAAQRGGIALVSLAGAGRPFGDIMTEQMEMAMKGGYISKDAFASLKAAFAELGAGRTITKRPPNIPDELWNGLFPPRAQEYLISSFKYDPVVEMAKLPAKGVKILIVQGTNDLTGGDGDPALLAKAAGVTPVIIEGMAHELKLAPKDRAKNDKMSYDPRVTLAPELFKVLIPFLNSSLK